MPPPKINLDPLRARARALLERDPLLRTLVGIAELAAPEAVAAVKSLDANLPHVLAAAQDHALGEVRAEATAASRKVARKLNAIVRAAVRGQGKAAPKTAKRLPAKQKKPAR